jgi:hypothetical protein
MGRVMARWCWVCGGVLSLRTCDLPRFSIGLMVFLPQGGRRLDREGSVPEHLVGIGRSLSLPERDRWH